jgi:hypothetical protein
MLFHYLQNVWDLAHDCSGEVYVCMYVCMYAMCIINICGFSGVWVSWLGWSGTKDPKKLLLGLGLEMTIVCT